MQTLSANEARVLGVMIEKAQTVPAQYPLTLNGIVTGCNQKNNRDPLMNLAEDDVLESLDSLRRTGYVREVMLSGSRVPKYRHLAREALEISTEELVILAELLLRGPQTLGELRGRASRMHELGSLDEVRGVLDRLRSRPGPLVREIAPGSGSRANRFTQLLAPDAHALDPRSQPAHEAATVAPAPLAGAELAHRVERLEAEVAALRRAIERITGSTAPIDDAGTSFDDRGNSARGD